jgi:succinate dehydrogenase/fumarate reductase flavoprotein subunit
MDVAELITDVLIVGAGGAGMYAAIAAAQNGAAVLLVDKGQIGRGGATVMAQMTVAVALGEQEPDSAALHLSDTLKAGRGLCDETLSALLCSEGPARILEMERWGTRWAREQGHIKQEHAPGHSVKRCCYVDFLNTGPAVAATLRRKASECSRIRRISNLAVVELVIKDQAVLGAIVFDLSRGSLVLVQAKAIILAAGGLTKLYARSSASAHMGGEAYALALEAGAQLVDMEFVQFFPIGHLAPRLVGMDPIMWDPFRYKLGGKLLNGRFEEFIDRYGSSDFGRYNATRDIAAFAILKEVEAGRGTPHGGAYLDFRRVSEISLRAAFGPVIDRLAKNGIDLARNLVEVGPMAHYHMGGIRVDENMATRVRGLYAAGEAVGGAHGANRLSGNAITEAFVFGHRAGLSAAAFARSVPSLRDAQPLRRVRDATRALLGGLGKGRMTAAKLQNDLQDLMWHQAGPFRSAAKLSEALARLRQMRRQDLGAVNIGSDRAYNLAALEWFELRAMLAAAEAVVLAALSRPESRGAHQREDYPASHDAFVKNQILELGAGELRSSWEEPVHLAQAEPNHG